MAPRKLSAEGELMSKRPDGSLERDVLMVLWQSNGPLLPAEVQEQLKSDLAYTSVATILNRLQAKGLVSRTARGRAYAYDACVDESELATRRINDILAGADDRTAVLAGFIGALPKRERSALRALLEDA
jgi:predicted transcriptional regulator